MSTNALIASAFEHAAALLELLGEDKFRISAHARVARAVNDLTTDLATIANDPKALTAIEGIGAKTAAKIEEFVRTGKVEEFDELAARVPAGLPALLNVPGLGPKTVRRAWQELGIEDVDALKAAMDDGSLAGLPRLGAKAVEKIRKGLDQLERSAGRLPLGIAMPMAEQIVAFLQALDGVERAAFAGSLRRGKDTIGDLDMLVVAADAAAVHEAFCAHEDVVSVIARGESKSSVLMKLSVSLGRWGRAIGNDAEPAVQVDLRVVEANAWGAAMQYFTGSKEHNVKLRERAVKQGLTLNEYGLFQDDGGDGPPQSRGLDPVASESEKDIYRALKVVFPEPELREDRGEHSAKKLPELIQLGDLKAELHAHTTESDGKLSLDELTEGAIARGFHTIAVTDHSKSSAQAGGLDQTRLRAQAKQIDEARDRFGKRVRILKGSEVDILADGSLDFDDDTLASLDVVVASPHTALSQEPTAATKRLLRAIEHPMVHILGHPTGRLINARGGLEPAMDELIAAAKEHNVALEINAHWMRLDLRDTHVRAAVEAGCLLAIDCDVHAMGDFDNARYGVLTGRRGWLTAEQCVNCWPVDQLSEWLKSKR